MILAAGMSSRMKTSSSRLINKNQARQANNRPKCMIEIGQSKIPFLKILLNNIIASDVEEVCLVLNEHDSITKKFINSQNIDLKFNFVIQKISPKTNKPMGTADAILQGLNGCTHWRECQFLVCNSDNLYSKDAFQLLLSSPYKNAMIDYDFFSFFFPYTLSFTKERVCVLLPATTQISPG